MGCNGSKSKANRRDTLHKPRFGEDLEAKNNQIQLKVCMAGDAAVGKSLFYHKFFNTMNKFTNTTTPPNGDNNCKRLDIPGSGPVLLSVWDTAGQERYKAITKIFYKGANGVIILFDVTSKVSFNRIEEFWLKEFKDDINTESCVVTLVGNKIDLPNRVVTSEEGQALAAKHGMLYKEVSALQGTGIDETITATVEKIIAVQKPVPTSNYGYN